MHVLKRSDSIKFECTVCVNVVCTFMLLYVLIRMRCTCECSISVKAVNIHVSIFECIVGVKMNVANAWIF